MQVFEVFGIVPDARSPRDYFEDPVDFVMASGGTAGSYKTTALPLS